MSLESGKIDGYGFMMLVAGFVMGSSLLLIPGRGAGHDAWIAVLLGLAEGLLFVLLFAGLGARFPGKTLVEIADTVYGRFPGKLVSGAFICYLLHLGGMVLANFTIYFSTLFMPTTPKVVFMLLIVYVCASAAGKGIETLTRCSEALVPLIVVVFFLDDLMLIGNYKPGYLLPVLEVPISRLLPVAHGAASFPFAETVAFLMVTAFLKRSRDALPSTAKGLILSGLILSGVAARNAAVLGPTEEMFIFPSYQVITLINIAYVTRVEILISLTILLMGFLKVSTLLYGISLGTAQLFGLKSFRPLVLPAGILMSIAGLQSFAGTWDMRLFAKDIYPIYALPFQLGIPLLTLLLAWIRKLPREEA